MTAYFPANATEGDAFERRWCDHCVEELPFDAEDELGDYTGFCPNLTAAKSYVPPGQWVVRDGMPTCLAFVEDRSNPARCLFTKEMFE